MTVAVQTITGRAATVLIDEGHIRWSEAQLLDWVNEAQNQIVNIKRDANIVNANITTVQGPRQTIPSDGVMLMDVHSNGLGYPVKQVNRKDLDRHNPTWRSATPTADVREYYVTDDDKRVLYVNPPASSGATINIDYCKRPTTLTINDNIELDDIYQAAILDWVLYRAFSIDTDFSAAQGLAETYRQNFFTALGVSIQAEEKEDVRANVD